MRLPNKNFILIYINNIDILEWFNDEGHMIKQFKRNVFIKKIMLKVKITIWAQTLYNSYDRNHTIGLSEFSVVKIF